MKKQRIIIIILVVIIVLLVVYIFWGQKYFPVIANQTGSGAAVTSSLQAGASANPEAVVVSPASSVTYSPAPSDLYTNIKNYSGTYLELSGAIYTEPSNIEGMLSFYIQTDDSQYASINFLDMNKTMDLSKGEKVTIKGIVTNSVNAENPNGLLVDMPMIEANFIEKAD